MQEMQLGGSGQNQRSVWACDWAWSHGTLPALRRGQAVSRLPEGQ